MEVNTMRSNEEKIVLLNEDFKLEETRLDFIRNLVHFKKKLTMEEFTKPSNLPTYIKMFAKI